MTAPDLTTSGGGRRIFFNGIWVAFPLTRSEAMNMRTMGGVVALWLGLGLAACGDSGTATGGNGPGGQPGTGGDPADGGAPSAGGDPNVGGDPSVGGAPGEGGAGGAPSDCDPVAQDCTDPVATKCTLIIDAAFTAFIDEECMAPKGDAMLGEPCVRPTNTPGIDTCASTYCANFGNAGTTERTCHTICQSDDICAEGEACLGMFELQYGACSVECNPFPTDNCAAGSCSATTKTSLEWGFFCFPSTGSTPDGAVCTTFDECLDGSSCLASETELETHCRPYCDPTHPCDAGFDCSPFESDTPGAEDVGICFPAP